MEKQMAENELIEIKEKLDEAFGIKTSFFYGNGGKGGLVFKEDHLKALLLLLEDKK